MTSSFHKIKCGNASWSDMGLTPMLKHFWIWHSLKKLRCTTYLAVIVLERNNLVQAITFPLAKVVPLSDRNKLVIKYMYDNTCTFAV